MDGTDVSAVQAQCKAKCFTLTSHSSIHTSMGACQSRRCSPDWEQFWVKCLAKGHRLGEEQHLNCQPWSLDNPLYLLSHSRPNVQLARIWSQQKFYHSNIFSHHWINQWRRRWMRYPSRLGGCCSSLASWGEGEDCSLFLKSSYIGVTVAHMVKWLIW